MIEFLNSFLIGLLHLIVDLLLHFLSVLFIDLVVLLTDMLVGIRMEFQSK